jgi:hypothetical protein
MSRGLGRRQILILELLASREGGVATGEMALWCGDPEGWRAPWGYFDDRDAAMRPWLSGLSSIRRALAAMESMGLVEKTGYVRHTEGRPYLWVITDAGRSALQDRVRRQYRPRDNG